MEPSEAYWYYEDESYDEGTGYAESETMPYDNGQFDCRRPQPESVYVYDDEYYSQDDEDYVEDRDVFFDEMKVFG